jgi:hypothetical protein
MLSPRSSSCPGARPLDAYIANVILSEAKDLSRSALGERPLGCPGNAVAAGDASFVSMTG